jgi:twitching motility protein PilT
MQDTGASATDAMHKLLMGMLESEASDLHLVPGHRPTYRVHGRLVPTRADPVDAATSAAMIESIVPQALHDRFHSDLNLDFSVPLTDPKLSTPHRFRANVFRSHGNICACFRHIPTEVPSFDWMGFPKATAEQIVNLTNGLVIITGITGSGKTTTLAGIVNLLNHKGGYRIITVEEPIEYVYPPSDHTLITQREVATDCASFHDGLKYGLRQDPDVILVGEIRDRETARMALSAAETGHLILTTMHTKDAKGAVTRFVDLFPHDAQDDIRAQLALNLRYVIAQHLLPPAQLGDKRTLAIEKMVVNQPIRAGIKFGKIESIESAIQTGRADGMIRLDDSLQSLFFAGRITRETARRFAKDPESLRSAGP